jgi:hypothetical protein
MLLKFIASTVNIMFLKLEGPTILRLTEDADAKAKRYTSSFSIRNIHITS